MVYVIRVIPSTDRNGNTVLTAETSPMSASGLPRCKLRRQLNAGEGPARGAINIAVELMSARFNARPEYVRAGLHSAEGPDGAVWVVYQD